MNKRIVNWILILVGCTWLLSCALMFSNAGTNIFNFVIAFWLGIIWIIFWLIRVVIAAWRYRKKPTDSIKNSLKKMLIELGIILTPIAFASSGTFSYARFIVSESALLQYAEEVRAGKVDLNFEFVHEPRQIGLYEITVTDLLEDGTVRIITSQHGLLNKAGFVNSTKSPPPKRGEDSYKHLHGDWWYWYESW